MEGDFSTFLFLDVEIHGGRTKTFDGCHINGKLEESSLYIYAVMDRNLGN